MSSLELFSEVPPGPFTGTIIVVIVALTKTKFAQCRLRSYFGDSVKSLHWS